MLPTFGADGLLPAGEHAATWDEVTTHLAWNAHRQRLLGGLQAALVPLRTAGCRRLYLDGSFATNKELPSDYDAAWDPSGVDLTLLLRLEPVFFDFSSMRAAQKTKYLGEFFPSTAVADAVGTRFWQFFQIDKNTGSPKGIVVLTL
jgi:hypothetical protein